jgi:phospholipase C
VSWINAPSIYCEHPGPSSPVQGAWFLQEVLDALTAVPEVWSKTVLIVNFDENDGYFDHVPSPSAPSLDADGKPAGKTTLADADLAPEYFTHRRPPAAARSQPARRPRVRPGPRVPMYVISPWSRGGWVNSQVFDHTSVLRFLEARFGVKEPNISPFRRAVCGDLTSAFNFATPNGEAPPSLMPAGRPRPRPTSCAQDQQALAAVPLPLDPQLPRQPPARGLRARCPTSCTPAPGPMRSAARCSCCSPTPARRRPCSMCTTSCTSTASRAATWWSGQDAGRRWSRPPATTACTTCGCSGPTASTATSRATSTRCARAMRPSPEVRVCYDVANGNVYLSMRNDGKAACRFTISRQGLPQRRPVDGQRGGGASAEQHWDAGRSGQWYDFAVTCDADPAYYRRFAGRVETGKHTVSDPAMGLPEL